MFAIDMSIYFPTPQLTTGDFVSLIRTLIRFAPKNPPAHVQTAIDELKKALAIAESTLVVRIDEDLSTRLERAFDTLVDYVWNELRRRLEFAGIYNHPGAAMFTEEDRQELEIEERIEEAHTASTMSSRIFANGVDFLRTSFSQQSTHMAARLDWVDAKDFGPMLEEIVGPKLVTLLQVCQRRYEAMVEDRSSRDGKSAADLRELRSNMRRQIGAYCGVIGSMYSVDDPDSAKIVEAALRPILIARAHSRRKDLGIQDQPEDVIEELEHELQDLADELEQQLGPDQPLDPEQDAETE